jgi:hypothetical protein
VKGYPVNIVKANITPARWLLLRLLIFCPAACLHAGPAVQAWVQRYNGTDSQGAVATAIAAGPVGVVYVTGDSSGTNSYPDFATIAYSTAGAPLWTNSYAAPGNSYNYAEAIAVDANSGNVYVTGESYYYNSEGGDDLTTVAYSSAGVPLWTNRSDVSSPDVRALAVGPNGNVYVGGSLGGMEVSYTTLAYSASGAPLWSNIACPGQVEGIAVDGAGNVYVAGGGRLSGAAQTIALPSPIPKLAVHCGPTVTPGRQ